jgi:hypothetical protein
MKVIAILLECEEQVLLRNGWSLENNSRFLDFKFIFHIKIFFFFISKSLIIMIQRVLYECDFAVKHTFVDSVLVIVYRCTGKLYFQWFCCIFMKFSLEWFCYVYMIKGIICLGKNGCIYHGILYNFYWLSFKTFIW